MTGHKMKHMFTLNNIAEVYNLNKMQVHNPYKVHMHMP